MISSNFSWQYFDKNKIFMIFWTFAIHIEENVYPH